MECLTEALTKLSWMAEKHANLFRRIPRLGLACEPKRLMAKAGGGEENIIHILFALNVNRGSSLFHFKIIFR
jgi:hypothetical protein